MSTKKSLENQDKENALKKFAMSASALQDKTHALIALEALERMGFSFEAKSMRDFQNDWVRESLRYIEFTASYPESSLSVFEVLVEREKNDPQWSQTGPRLLWRTIEKFQKEKALHLLNTGVNPFTDVGIHATNLELLDTSPIGYLLTADMQYVLSKGHKELLAQMIRTHGDKIEELELAQQERFAYTCALWLLMQDPKDKSKEQDIIVEFANSQVKRHIESFDKPQTYGLDFNANALFQHLGQQKPYSLTQLQKTKSTKQPLPPVWMNRFIFGVVLQKLDSKGHPLGALSEEIFLAVVQRLSEAPINTEHTENYAQSTHPLVLCSKAVSGYFDTLKSLNTATLDSDEIKYHETAKSEYLKNVKWMLPVLEKMLPNLLKYASNLVFDNFFPQWAQSDKRMPLTFTKWENEKVHPKGVESPLGILVLGFLQKDPLSVVLLPKILEQVGPHGAAKIEQEVAHAINSSAFFAWNPPVKKSKSIPTQKSPNFNEELPEWGLDATVYKTQLKELNQLLHQHAGLWIPSMEGVLSDCANRFKDHMNSVFKQSNFDTSVHTETHHMEMNRLRILQACLEMDESMKGANKASLQDRLVDTLEEILTHPWPAGSKKQNSAFLQEVCAIHKNLTSDKKETLFKWMKTEQKEIQRQMGLDEDHMESFLELLQLQKALPEKNPKTTKSSAKEKGPKALRV